MIEIAFEGAKSTAAKGPTSQACLKGSKYLSWGSECPLSFPPHWQS